MSKPRGQNAILSDEELQRFGVGPRHGNADRHGWTQGEWRAFLDGWGSHRGISADRPLGRNAAYFDAGRHEAAHFDG